VNPSLPPSVALGIAPPMSNSDAPMHLLENSKPLSQDEPSAYATSNQKEASERVVAGQLEVSPLLAVCPPRPRSRKITLLRAQASKTGHLKHHSSQWVQRRGKKRWQRMTTAGFSAAVAAAVECVPS